jgi:hypothetical protein
MARAFSAVLCVHERQGVTHGPAPATHSLWHRLAQDQADILDIGLAAARHRPQAELLWPAIGRAGIDGGHMRRQGDPARLVSAVVRTVFCLRAARRHW